MLAEINSSQHLVPTPFHYCPDLCQQKLYSMLQLGIITFHGLIYAVPGLATERELNT